MSTEIEWTDETWNPVRGCTKVSPGCAHCYAETFAERFRGVPGHAYEQGFDLRLVPESLELPLRWKKPRRIFVNSMSDLFHEGVPDEYIDRVFAVMALAHQHTFQVLTKRAERMRDYISRTRAIESVYAAACRVDETIADRWRWPLPNVWLGVSVENQHFADERSQLLLQTPAAVRFISAEPLLAAVDLGLTSPRSYEADCQNDGIIWVIVGGESGPGARPFDLAWARSIVRQCQAALVPVFVKQLGSWAMTDEFPSSVTANGFPLTDRPSMAGNRLVLHDRKGGDMAECPEDLRVREFPGVRSCP